MKGQLIKRDYSDDNTPDLTYTYDALGRPLVATTNLGTATDSYLTAVGTGPLNKRDKTINTLGAGAGITTNYAYYPAVNTTHRWCLQQLKHSYTTGLVMKAQHDYTYDTDGTLVTWRYQSPGNGANIPALDRTWTATHDEVDQLTNVRSTIGTSGTEIENWRYAYEKMGNRTLEMHGGTATITTSDVDNRLTQRGGAGTTQVAGLLSAPATVSITVEPDGQPVSAPVAAKVTSIPGSTDWKFEKDVALPAGDSTLTITADGGTPPATVQSYAVNVPSAFSTYHYDANGNLIQQKDGQTLAVQRTYTWDAQNRLTRITYADNSSSEFQYDGNSQRRRIIERDSSSVITSDKYLLWLGHRVWQERDSLRRATAKLHHNGHELLTYVGTSTTPSATDLRLVLRDHLGSSREVVAAAGVVERRRDYDPYGKVSETAIATAKVNTAVAYTGHYLHAPSGLELTWYRAYDPVAGKWLSEDPIGERGGLNLLAYTANGPLSKIDKLGLDDIFIGVEGEGVPLIGGAGTIGIVIDTDDWRDCGIGWGGGLGGGGSIGAALGFQYYTDEFEGYGLEVDVNLGLVSPSGGVTLDDNGNITGHWGGISVGPGKGACIMVDKGSSLTIGDVLDTIESSAGSWNWEPGMW